ncbi:CoA transferase [Actibacterium sp. D379-3]
MFQILTGMRVVEGASFIAGPSAGMYLGQLGAEVIRFDHLGGGPDYGRWPRTGTTGHSLYWEGLNKGKKSVVLNLKSPEGRELALAIATAPGPEAGVFVTNHPAEGFLSHAALTARRADMITVRVMGWGDGQNAMDNTVNAAVGIPDLTGFADSDRPVNHVLPAWDLLAGAYAAFALLAAERHRRMTGAGQEVRVPLGDVAIAAVANLGQFGEVALSGADRARHGNDLFGAFGRDFVTADGRRIMLIALTKPQWRNAVAALNLGDQVAQVERALGVELGTDEGLRFTHREALFPLFEAAIGKLRFDDLTALLAAHRVTWGPYQSLKRALDTDPRFSAANPMLAEIEQASGTRYLSAGSAASYSSGDRGVPVRAPKLGEHTEQVLAEVLGLSGREIAGLRDRSVIAGTCD